MTRVVFRAIVDCIEIEHVGRRCVVRAERVANIG